jgi:hypothetical protein
LLSAKMLFSSSLTVLLTSGVASVVAQQSYGNANHTSPGGNESLANAPYSTLHSPFASHTSRTWIACSDTSTIDLA